MSYNTLEELFENEVVWKAMEEEVNQTQARADKFGHVIQQYFAQTDIIMQHFSLIQGHKYCDLWANFNHNSYLEQMEACATMRNLTQDLKEMERSRFGIRVKDSNDQTVTKLTHAQIRAMPKYMKQMQPCCHIDEDLLSKINDNNLKIFEQFFELNNVSKSSIVHNCTQTIKGENAKKRIDSNSKHIWRYQYHNHQYFCKDCWLTLLPYLGLLLKMIATRFLNNYNKCKKISEKYKDNSYSYNPF